MQLKPKPLVKLILVLLMTLPLMVNAQITKNTVDINSEKIVVDVNDLNSEKYLFEMNGPDNYHFSQVVDTDKRIEIQNGDSKGKLFTDGLYQIQITPYYVVDAAYKLEYQAARNSNDLLRIENFKKRLNITQSNYIYIKSISVKNGKFVYPNIREDMVEVPGVSPQWMDSYLNQTASLHPLEMASSLNLTLDNTPAFFDQVFIDDVIVDGSICVGQDCVNGESFGFDTGRYKENNLRVHFDDTSNSASFPSNDWRITINDSSNGGASYFAVSDATAGTNPFRVDAGAGNNAIYVSSSGGNVGMGTASPVVELHVTDGDSPTMRLEQNGASGWTPQTWDVAGNETNFFVRDVTNGSKLPFKIRPGAPDNSLYLNTNGNIGLGTSSPAQKLVLESGNAFIKAGKLGINISPTAALDVVGTTKMNGNLTYTGNITATISGTNNFFNPSFSPVLVLDATNTRVGIGKFNPAHLLELGMDDAVKPNGGSWTAPSDRRLKTNIITFKDGLNVVMKMNPVTYNYNGLMGYSTEKTFVGIIAQDMQEIAPYTVRPLGGENKENYLAYDGTPVTFILVNSIQEQQKMIDAQKEEIAELKRQVNQLNELKAMVSSLAGQVEAMTVEGKKVSKATEE